MSSGAARALSCPACGGPLDPDRRACGHCSAVCQTRRCAGCLALNIATDRNCRACGRLLPAESRADGAAAQCAGCGASMARRQAGAASFDECDRCGGLWLSPQTMEAINAQAETRAALRPFDEQPAGAGADAPSPVRIAYRKCPACRKHMNRDSLVAGSGVVLDLCRQHGCFFDHGELTRLLGFIEGGGLEKARRRDAEALKAEIGALERRKIAVRATTGEMPADWDPRGTSVMDLMRWVADLCRSR